MIKTLFVFTILCAAPLFGQTAASISNQQSIVSIPSHPQHAEHHSLATEHPLVGGSDTYSYAQGERPLWEFGPVSEPVPLGDVARANRREKLVAKKAQVVFEKQGSKPSR